MATGLPSAASFKHVSPAGAAVGLPLSETDRKIYFVDAMEEELSPIACAYIRARGADRLCSYGDWAALSDICDADTARYHQAGGLRRRHRPGLYRRGPGDPQSQEKGRNYNVVQIDPDYVPQPPSSTRMCSASPLSRAETNCNIDEELL